MVGLVNKLNKKIIGSNVVKGTLPLFNHIDKPNYPTSQTPVNGLKWNQIYGSSHNVVICRAYEAFLSYDATFPTLVF